MTALCGTVEPPLCGSDALWILTNHKWFALEADTLYSITIRSRLVFSTGIDVANRI